MITHKDASAPTHVRYVVLLLTVFLYMITYLDRVLLSTAMPSIQKEFGFSVISVGWILACYNLAYALFQIPGGWMGDRFGPRAALAGVVLWWSFFTASTALTWSMPSMAICLFLFGMGEAGAFPIATRSLSRWILPAERGFAQGATHAGSRLGSAITPVLVAFLIVMYGWRRPFFLFAIVGLIWAAVWFWYYRDVPAEHSGVNDGELVRIQAALGNKKVSHKSIPWKRILTSSQMWILAAMYACYGYGVNVYLAWFPKYLNQARGFDLQMMGALASLPFLAAVVGDLCGGWLSDRLVRRTGNITYARRAVAISGYILAAVTVPVAVLSPDIVPSVFLFALALFGLELTVGNSWAVTLDIGGEYAGSVSAVMNTCGNLGAAGAAVFTGYIVRYEGWNAVFFVVSAVAVIGALLFARIDASRGLFDGRRTDTGMSEEVFRAKHPAPR